MKSTKVADELPQFVVPTNTHTANWAETVAFFHSLPTTTSRITQ